MLGSGTANYSYFDIDSCFDIDSDTDIEGALALIVEFELVVSRALAAALYWH